MEPFKVNERGTGSAQYYPRMMLALLICCYAHGIFGSRRIERATHRDVGVRYVAANCHPDHDTICRFRRENFEAVGEAFLRVLLMARELKLLKVGTVSVDGTKLDANASKRNSLRRDRAQALRAQLRGEIKDLLDRAERADAEERLDSEGLPEGLRRREKLKAKLDRACAEMDRRARSQAAKERMAYERKVAARDKREGRAKGAKIKPPSQEPRPEEQINLTDSDSALMRKNKRSEWRQAHDFRPPAEGKGAKEPKAVWLKRMKEKMETEENRALYRLRKQTVEPVFGIVKEAMGFRRFLLRGQNKVEGEWALVTLAYNCKRLHRLRMA